MEGNRSFALGKDFILSFSAGIVLFVFGLVSGWLEGPWRIDEAHKVSEAAFLRLIAGGDFHSPHFTGDRVDRVNPIVGKLALGVAIAAWGVPLPDFPTLSSRVGATGLMPGLPEAPAVLVPALRPARFASLLATCLAAFFCTLMSIRWGGRTAAVVAFSLLASSFLTSSTGATAVFDPLLLLFTVATAYLLAEWLNCEVAGTRLVLGTSAGVTAALAFQTRLSGGLLACAAMLIFTLEFLRMRRTRVLSSTSLFGLTFVSVSVSVNPFYWSGAESAWSLPSLVLRRIMLQLTDSSALLEALQAEGATFSSRMEKWKFIMETLFGDLPGLLLLLSLTAAVLLIVTKRWRLDRHASNLLIVNGIIAALYLLWLPLPWPRYLFVPLAPLTVCAGLGVAALADLLRSRFRKV